MDININIGNSNSDLSKKSNINKEIFKAYYEELNQLRDELKISDQLGARYNVMNWFDVNRNLFEAVGLEKIVIFFY